MAVPLKKERVPFPRRKLLSKCLFFYLLSFILKVVFREEQEDLSHIKISNLSYFCFETSTQFYFLLFVVYANQSLQKTTIKVIPSFRKVCQLLTDHRLSSPFVPYFIKNN